MVYRIHCTLEDVARTRVAEVPMPLSEFDLAVRALQARSQPARLDVWRRRVFTELGSAARMVLSLIPPVGWSPGFLTPPHGGDIEEALDKARSVPRQQVRAELAAIAEHQPIPGWARHLADDARLLQQVFDAVGSLYATLVQPYRAELAAGFAAARGVHARRLLAGGMERVLAEANPRWMRWSAPVLEIRMPNRIDYDLRLEGQGILLVPSLWGTRTIVDDDTQPQPTVTYPICHDQPLQHLTAVSRQPDRTGSPQSASRLLGSTRAAVLDAVA